MGPGPPSALQRELAELLELLLECGHDILEPFISRAFEIATKESELMFLQCLWILAAIKHNQECVKGGVFHWVVVHMR
jgi:hypothetical protein